MSSALDPTVQLAVDLPDHQPLSGPPVATASRYVSREASGPGATDDASDLLVSRGARPEERIAASGGSARRNG